MEEYPEELRTPPVTLISMVGCPELHALISTHLLSGNPPINTLALPDLSKICLFSKKKDSEFNATTSPPSSVGGILKRDWLLKHRTKIPSVLAALFPAQHVFGDPAQWLQVCFDLDSIRTVIRARNIKLAIVIVHSDARDEISEDRMIALRKRAEVDPKYALMFNPNDTSELEQSISRLANTFTELASTHYRDEGRRIRLRIEKKSVSPVELIVRYCFEVAVYAEFQSDWAEALKYYEEAYHTLREIVGVSTRLPAVQRLIEIKTIAEQLHFKISTLLLHSGKVTEAVTWFHQHKKAYRKLVGVPEAIFLHWEWMSRQFLVFGELLETSSKNTQFFSPVDLDSSANPVSNWECYPAYYYQLAAQYLSEKRSALELAVSMSEASNEIDSSAESVVPSVYVGQFARLLEQEDQVAMLPLTDEEYTRYAVSEGRRFRDSYEIIALLKKAYESYSNLRVQRMSSFCGFQMAKEYFAEDDISNAKQIFDNVATLYRKEGWVTLLWDVLGYLRECSLKNGNVKEFVEYSLELAALPVSSVTGVQRDTGPAGPAGALQREIIHKEVFELLNKASGFPSNERLNDLKITGDKPLHLDVDLVSPLRLVLLASVAFHEQTFKPGASTMITISLLSKLPLTVEIDQLDVQFNQPDCNFTIANAQKPQAIEVTGVQQCRVEKSPSLSLASNKWLRLIYDIKSDKSGKLECLSVVAKIGSHFTICCVAESPASLDSLALWTPEECIENLPIKDPILALSGLKSSQVEEPDPQVDLYLGASGPALVEELFMVPVTVTSKGHDVYSGELKINLVDVRGGGLFSPRESESFSSDSHVELLGITGQEGGNEFQLDSDKIKKIQQSFGLISVPFLKKGDSWSCKLEIKWHRPKPIMLYVSLSYTPYVDESNSQKFHVHKNLQIEGNAAVVLSHHFFAPFRQDSLLLSRTSQALESDQAESLPLNEKTVLIASAKNCAEIPLRLQSLSIEAEDDAADERACSIQGGNSELSKPALLVPGEEFKKVFTVTSNVNILKLRLGTVCLRWRRDLGSEEQSLSTNSIPWAVTKQKLPDMKVELPPLIVSLDCPPYAILGDSFTYYVKILNRTKLLQEVKYSLGDAQSFVLSGSHNDTIYVLPKSEHILSYKLVPLASGIQHLPKISLTSVRYSAEFQPSNSSTSVFVFPSKPHFNTAASTNKRIEAESVANE